MRLWMDLLELGALLLTYAIVAAALYFSAVCISAFMMWLFASCGPTAL